ncbi:hypothetical protein BC831DRAFT_459181 [Entophlyctis helioformis]|nr:hypothetical protein BC831DRAFT_459181 [Entophlyctis helioformis]
MAAHSSCRVQMDTLEQLPAQIMTMMTNDTEAFVRRAAIGLVESLVQDRHHRARILLGSVAGSRSRPAVLIEPAHGNELRDGVHRRLMPADLKRCCVDEDLEVRIQSVHLLLAVFGSIDEMEAMDDLASHPFFVADGDVLLESMMLDFSRLVRIEAIRAAVQLRSLHTSAPPSGGKRTRLDGTRLAAFMGRLAVLDVGEMLRRCEPEHLYQEALDMDASVLDEMHEAGEGNNILTCYDC